MFSKVHDKKSYFFLLGSRPYNPVSALENASPEVKQRLHIIHTVSHFARSAHSYNPNGDLMCAARFLLNKTE